MAYGSGGGSDGDGDVDVDVDSLGEKRASSSELIFTD